MTLRIIFAGTPEFAVPSLRAVAVSGHQVVTVLTQPDRPAGRGRQLAASPVKQEALNLGLSVSQPASLREPDAQQALGALKPDLIVVAAYGLILPRAVLDLPSLGCLNVHASLLPRWRGAAPIQRAILAGDLETGISLMHMDAGLDTGDIYLRAAIPIGAAETAGELHDRLAALGANCLADALPALAERSLAAVSQNAADACYAAKLTKSEAEIDWQEDAQTIARRVRAYNPWPIAQTSLGGTALRIHRAYPLPTMAPAADPGLIVRTGEPGIDVGCGTGALRILELQRAGGRVLNARDYARGQALLGLKLGKPMNEPSPAAR